MGVAVSFGGNPSAPVLLLAPGWVDSIQSAPRILPSFFTYPRRSIEKPTILVELLGMRTLFLPVWANQQVGRWSSPLTEYEASKRTGRKCVCERGGDVLPFLKLYSIKNL